MNPASGWRITKRAAASREVAAPDDKRKKPSVDCDEWSRCEKGESRACFCTSPGLTPANALILVPLPEWRPKVLMPGEWQAAHSSAVLTKIIGNFPPRAAWNVRGFGAGRLPVRLQAKDLEAGLSERDPA